MCNSKPVVKDFLIVVKENLKEEIMKTIIKRSRRFNDSIKNSISLLPIFVHKMKRERSIDFFLHKIDSIISEVILFYSILIKNWLKSLIVHLCVKFIVYDVIKHNTHYRIQYKFMDSFSIYIKNLHKLD